MCKNSVLTDILMSNTPQLLTVLFAFFIVMPTPASADPKIKQPNVSGQFYEANAGRLSADIDKYFNEAGTEPSGRRIDIIIAPHAGYIYSGGVAAYSFKSVSQKRVNTVVILAPSHYVGFDGISVWEEGGFETPLGVVPVDEQFTKQLIASNEKFYFAPQAFETEHSLEVEIPFLQKTFKDFKIVPIIMGQPSFELLGEFAKSLNKIIGDRSDVLIVVSTDLSHYHDDAYARAMDRHTIEAVKALQAEQVWNECRARTMEMCGCVPATAAMLYARVKGLTEADILRYANSGDVTGDRDRVVGYASVVIYGKDAKSPNDSELEGKKTEKPALTIEQKRALMDIARKTIDQYVRTGQKMEVRQGDQRLALNEGAFVTIHKNGQLRGCIGNIVTQKPLYMTVRDMAIAAATEDPRFPRVLPEELDQIDLEISVLSLPRVIRDVGEIELGVHGVIVSKGPLHYGVFLPQVADETHWTKEEFLSQLCAQKAHLPADAWKDPSAQIEIFTADVFSEKDVR